MLRISVCYSLQYVYVYSKQPYPIIVRVLNCKHQIVYGISLSYFYACLRLRFLDVETNPGPRRPVPGICRILCSNVRGMAVNLSDLTVASYQYDILFLSETFVSDMCHVSELLVTGFVRPVLLCRGKIPRARGMADAYGMVKEHLANPNLSVVVAKC